MSIEDIKPLIQWLHHNPFWAGVVTCFISAAESLPIIGYLIPGSLIMPAIGALIGANIIPMSQTLLWAILGAVLGDGLSYWLGAHYNERVRSIWPLYHYPTLFDRGEQFFKNHGGKSVFIGRFVGPVRPMVPMIAGMMNMNRLHFFITNVTSGILWAPAYMLPGVLLGAAALELPPEIATKFILGLLAILVGLTACMWLIKKIISVFLQYSDALLDRFWSFCYTHRYSKHLCVLLRDPLQPHRHGQLSMGIAYITMIMLFVMMCAVQSTNVSDIGLNQFFYYLMRSMRIPSLDVVMAQVTQLGDKIILFPCIIAVFGWLLIQKHYRSAAHWIVNSGLVYCSVYFFKKFMQTPRPPGLLTQSQSFSFPSGHTTIAIAIYAFASLLISRNISNPRLRVALYYSAGILATLIIISRLYLGKHWATDVIGGILLGLCIFFATSISYRRELPENVNAKALLTVIAVTLIPVFLFKNLTTNVSEAYQPHFSKQTITMLAWWEQDSSDVTQYRRTRTGKLSNLMNIQWLGPLDKIESHLLLKGWAKPHTLGLSSALARFNPQTRKHRLPLLEPLYKNHTPSLTLVKLSDDKPMQVLRLWQSQLHVAGTNYPLWMGTLRYHVSTHHHFTNGIPKGPWQSLTTPTQLLLPELKPYHARAVQSQEGAKQIDTHRIGSNGEVLLIKPLPTLFKSE